MPYTVRCAVVGCESNSDEKNDTFSFHFFPKNEDLRMKWILATNKPSGWQPSKVSVICSKHFRCQDKRKSLKRSNLVKGAIPGLYPELDETIDIKEDLSCIEDLSHIKDEVEPVYFKSKFIQVYIRSSIRNVKTQAKITRFSRKSIKCQTILSRNVETQTDILPVTIRYLENPIYELRKRPKKLYKYL